MGDAIPQLLVNGIALGAAYALIALGFVLVINAVGAVNFAQGDLVMAGGFVAVTLAEILTSWLDGGEALIGLVVLGAILIAAQGSAIAPFIYAIF